MSDTNKGGKKNRKFGRQAHHPTHVHYNQNKTCWKNKAKRVRQSNGEQAYITYCHQHELKVSD